MLSTSLPYGARTFLPLPFGSRRSSSPLQKPSSTLLPIDLDSQEPALVSKADCEELIAPLAHREMNSPRKQHFGRRVLQIALVGPFGFRYLPHREIFRRSKAAQDSLKMPLAVPFSQNSFPNYAIQTTKCGLLPPNCLARCDLGDQYAFPMALARTSARHSLATSQSRPLPAESTSNFGTYGRPPSRSHQSTRSGDRCSHARQSCCGCRCECCWL